MSCDCWKLRIEGVQGPVRPKDGLNVFAPGFQEIVINLWSDVDVLYSTK
jgi:hypothetical protein